MELPKKIYLHLDDGAKTAIESTWSEDRIDDSDEEYIASRESRVLSDVPRELKICTGCSNRSDTQDGRICCPDNNYVSLDEYLKYSRYDKDFYIKRGIR